MSFENPHRGRQIVEGGHQNIPFHPTRPGSARIRSRQGDGAPIEHAGDPHRMLAMVGSLKFEHLRPLRRSLGDTEAHQCGLGSRSHEPNTLSTGNQGLQPLRQFDTPSVHTRKIVSVRHCTDHRFAYLGMGMSHQRRSPGHGQIPVLPSRCIPYPCPFPAGDDWCKSRWESELTVRSIGKHTQSTTPPVV